MQLRQSVATLTACLRRATRFGGGVRRAGRRAGRRDAGITSLNCALYSPRDERNSSSERTHSYSPLVTRKGRHPLPACLPAAPACLQGGCLLPTRRSDLGEPRRAVISAWNRHETLCREGTLRNTCPAKWTERTGRTRAAAASWRRAIRNLIPPLHSQAGDLEWRPKADTRRLQDRATGKRRVARRAPCFAVLPGAARRYSAVKMDRAARGSARRGGRSEINLLYGGLEGPERRAPLCRPLPDLDPASPPVLPLPVAALPRL